MGGEISKAVVENCGDENIMQAYEDIKSTLKMIEIQKNKQNAYKAKTIFYKENDKLYKAKQRYRNL